MAGVPTQKLYKTPSLDAYQQEQQTHIRQVFGNAYRNKSKEEKWRTIMDAFSQAAPHKATILQDFYRSRNESYLNLYNLSLDQCIDYFEHFYFLYTTDNPDFELTESQKKRFLELIEEAINTCETGKNMRFHQALQEFRRDNDWVLKELTHYRYQILLRMQDAYNNEHDVADIMAVHTLNAMLHIAREEGLGIPQPQAVRDVFTNPRTYNQIKTYFYTHYPALFSEYEQNVIDNLSLHLLLELKDNHHLFAEPDFDDWYTQENAPGFRITVNKIDTFKEFITSRFAFPEDELDINEFGEWSEDYTYFQVKGKQDFKQLLQKLVAKKLIQEGYFLPAELLKQEDKTKIRDPHLKNNWGGIVKLRQALQTPEPQLASLNLLFKESSQFIVQHPDMLLHAIQHHPKIILSLPTALKANPCFIEPILQSLDQLLLEALELDDQLAFEETLEALLFLVQYENKYTQHLSAQVLNHPIIAEKLLHSDGLILQKLSHELQDNEDIVEIAVRQNPHALFYASDRLKNDPAFLQHALSKLDLESSEYSAVTGNFDRYCEVLQMHYNQKHDILPFVIQMHCDDLYFPGISDCQNDIAIMQRIDAVHTLLKPEVSIQQMMHSTKAISPELLLKIVNHRQSNSLPPLPFSLKPSAIERFKRELEANPAYRAGDDWCTIRKNYIEQCGMNHSSDKSPMDFIAQTNHWFIAMVRYETSVSGRFSNLGQFTRLIKDFSKAFLHLCISVAKIYAYTVTAFFLADIFLSFSVSLPIALGANVLALVLHMMKQSVDNPLFTSLSLGAHVIAVATVLPEILTFATAYIAWANIEANAKNAFSQIANMFEALTTLFTRLFKTLFNVEVYNLPETNEANLSQKCAHGVYRLQTLEDVSAQEKGEVLESFLTEIEQETGCGEAGLDESLLQQVHKPRAFSYRGESHQMSFFEVASTRRNDSEQFRLQDNQSHSLFSRRTTTSRMIDQEKVEASIDLAVTNC